MLVLYFSGTGNSQFIATRFAQIMAAEVHSIEEDLEFGPLLENNETIAFVYPIYGSCVPMIMRHFVEERRELLQGKKIIIFCTQALFSGDGARVFTELLSGISYSVVWAEHFRMPTNICNFPLLPLASPKKCKALGSRATARLQQIGDSLRQGDVLKRGFSSFSKYLGFFTQRIYFARLEKKLRRGVRISSACTVCQHCIEVCPMGNLVLNDDNNVQQKGNCTLCYRCVNQCPGRAITVMTHSPVISQYEWQN
jgi:ferredoxin